MIVEANHWIRHGFQDDFYLPVLFYDEYVTVLGRYLLKMDEVSFAETSSVIDETDLSMNISVSEEVNEPDEPVPGTSGSSQSQKRVHQCQEYTS